jgi:hypothetical protein
MLRSLDELHGYSVHAVDGNIGKVDDFFFEDALWTVRYLVVDIGGWLSDRKVLISPTALRQPDWGKKVLCLSLNKDQVESSPEIDIDKPISRKHEEELNAHYEWPVYWEYGALNEEAKAIEKTRKSHLRSMKEVVGYRVKAIEGELGPVLDFIMDYETWIIRYMVISTRYIVEHVRDLTHGKKVLISPKWTEVSWADSEVYVDLPIQIIKDGPEYKSGVHLDRDFEEIIYDYYDLPAYWDQESNLLREKKLPLSAPE